MGFNLSDLQRKITGDVPVFGFASDGDHEVSGTETLTTVAEYRDLTVPAGAVLNTAGWMIYVNGTLTIEEGGIIQSNGNNASGGTGGSPPALGNSVWGAQGWNGDPIETAFFGDSYFGGLGGEGGTGTGGVPVGYSGNTLVSPKRLSTMPGLLIPSAISATLPRAGIGGLGATGDGVETGGGGGSSGGAVWLIAANVINHGIIQANGGNGAAGAAANCGGGGGGGGGLVHIVSRAYMGSGVIRALGGSGGASGGGSGTAGADGSVGLTHSFIVP